ncbi:MULTISPECIES: DUF2478 domain-containing protein [Rhodopseudomonas]|uniref:3-dehydroquinate dehydratase n=1 Tax=Rhodopseudomonas palustris TaxID=1076 RepID=A0A0D7EPA3_RHOPL|nr:MULTISPECIES: DUF2478 domain-containing protein [Rhodopseudomonas]KIZ42491.1 3-dehydroquinate dehydratase [Rhodopseudomonas palustris]MDF3813916.1 DUF2478 domain-containing protein [Rhodopseudomonas sp. BAL398]WOK15852.1 DUF2478 domain-containing protein [Rhodopseudomonas sp. BAL398]
MFRSHGTLARPSILGIVYSDGAAAGRFFSDFGFRLRDAGIAVAGIVPAGSRDRALGCDMEVEELASRIILQLSEDRAEDTAGCRLDPAALQEAAALISASMRNGPELLILNKFGPLETKGKGLCEVIGEAMECGIPVVVGVPQRNIGPWRVFTDGLAEEAAIGSLRLHHWLARRGFDTQHEITGAIALASSAA